MVFQCQISVIYSPVLHILTYHMVHMYSPSYSNGNHKHCFLYPCSIVDFYIQIYEMIAINISM